MSEQTEYSRRTVLKLGCRVGAAALAAMSVPGDLFTDRIVRAAARDASVPSFGPLIIFNPDQAALIHAFAEATLPHGEGFATALEARVVNRLDEELTFVSPGISGDFIKIVEAVEFMPKFMGEKSYFSELSREQRVAFLNSTLETDVEDIRAALSALRMSVCMVYYGHESTWAQINYDGPFTPLTPKPGVQREYYAQVIEERRNNG